jgi:hypothetical protein
MQRNMKHNFMYSTLFQCVLEVLKKIQNYFYAVSSHKLRIVGLIQGTILALCCRE